MDKGRRIIFITGGARSGKSGFALRGASETGGPKAFIATAEPGDEEMRQRIERHRESRGDEFDTFEEPLEIAGLISRLNGRFRVLILDCLTLWLANALNAGLDIEAETSRLISSVEGLHAADIFIVSNEVGMGIVPDNELARRFRDQAGILNQKIAKAADEVYAVIAGIPVKIK